MVVCTSWVTCAIIISGVPTSAQQAEYLSRLEAAIVREHNLARQNPREYAAYVAELRPFFEGRLLRLPGEIALQTQEGVDAVDEAIEFLRSAAPASPLTASRGMSLGARDHVRDQGPRGLTEHVGTDGSNPWDRVSRHGTWRVTVGENISYGSYEPDAARDVVIQLIVDDGVESRGHRDNIFSPEFHVMGVSCGDHATFGMMCVLVYAGSYTEAVGN
jgi:uncharacterized protein YkwD